MVKIYYNDLVLFFQASSGCPHWYIYTMSLVYVHLQNGFSHNNPEVVSYNLADIQVQWFYQDALYYFLFIFPKNGGKNIKIYTILGKDDWFVCLLFYAHSDFFYSYLDFILIIRLQISGLNAFKHWMFLPSQHHLRKETLDFILYTKTFDRSKQRISCYTECNYTTLFF